MIDIDCHKYIDFGLVRSWNSSTQFITHNRNLCLSRVPKGREVQNRMGNGRV